MKVTAQKLQEIIADGLAKAKPTIAAAAKAAASRSAQRATRKLINPQSYKGRVRATCGTRAKSNEPSAVRCPCEIFPITIRSAPS